MHIGRETFYGIEGGATAERSSDIYYMSSKENKIVAYAAQIQYFIQHRATVTHTHNLTCAITTAVDELHTFAVVFMYNHFENKGMALDSPSPVFTYKLDKNKYGWENFIPIRQIAGRCAKMPHYDYKKWKKAESGRGVHSFPDSTTFYTW